MKSSYLLWSVALCLMAANVQGLEDASSLLAARKGFETKLTREIRESEPLPQPPGNVLSLIRYKTPIGEMTAYLSKPDDEKKKHPAIVWITGGFPSGGIGDSAWTPVSSDNDQSAKAYRYAGLVMMYPTLRGSFGNPGKQESFFGEVDDVLAAVEYLRALDYVDPERIYLGGHSTGGTLALLVAAATDRFRGVISFGPIADPAGYGAESLTYDPADEKENRLRAPVHYLDSIQCPTYVIEGTEESNNVLQLGIMKDRTTNENVKFIPVKGANHFDILAPVNHFLGDKISKLESRARFELDEKEVQAAFDDWQIATREAKDLRILASVRAAGTPIDTSQKVRFYLVAWDESKLETAAKAARTNDFETDPVSRYKNDEGRNYYVLVLRKSLVLEKLDTIFAASRSCVELAKKYELYYDDWDVD